MFGSITQKAKIISKLSFAMIWSFVVVIFWHYRNEHAGMWVFLVLAVLLSWNASKAGIMLWMHMVHQDKLKAKSENVTDNFGSAGWATEAQMEATGLFDPNNGIPIGKFHGRPVFYSPVHSLNIAPAGGGKTTSIAIPSLCHGYRVPDGKGSSNPASEVITDLKGELAAQSYRLIQKQHGKKLFFLNPDGLFGLPSHSINPLQIVIDDLADKNNHKYAFADAKALVFQLHPDPPEGADKNSFFRNGSRLILIVIILWRAAEYPTLCTLPDIFTVISNSRTLKENLEVAAECKALSGDIASLAAGLLETPEDQFEDFRTGALQSVEAYAPSGPLAGSVSDSDFSFDILKKEAVSVFIIARYDRKDAYASWIGLNAYTAIQTLIRAGGNVPVRLLLDEATNFKLPNLANDLTALRGYGLRAQIICQAKSELIKTYGKQATETFYSQTDLKQFFGVTSYAEAKEISDMLGSYTVKTENLGAGEKPWDDIKDGISETGRPLMRPEEILRMSSKEQIVFIDKDGLPPIRCERLPYNIVHPWHGWLDDNPVEGGKLPPDPQIYIDYEEVKS